VAAGGISSFAKVEPKVSPTLAGTAIAHSHAASLCDWLGFVSVTQSGATSLPDQFVGNTLSCIPF